MAIFKIQVLVPGEKPYFVTLRHPLETVQEIVSALKADDFVMGDKIRYRRSEDGLTASVLSVEPMAIFRAAVLTVETFTPLPLVDGGAA